MLLVCQLRMSPVNHSWWSYKDCSSRTYASQKTFKRKYRANRKYRNPSLFLAGMRIDLPESFKKRIINTHDLICMSVIIFFTPSLPSLIIYSRHTFRGDLMKPTYPRQKEVFCNTIGELLWKVHIGSSRNISFIIKMWHFSLVMRSMLWYRVKDQRFVLIRLLTTRETTSQKK